MQYIANSIMERASRRNEFVVLVFLSLLTFLNYTHSPHPLPPNLTSSLAESVDKLLGAMEVQDHHLEHQLAAVQDHIKNLIGKLQAREDKSESRIDNLEALVKKVSEWWEWCVCERECVCVWWW